jgi:nicotinate-nucleotide--dimethylbenzimidazole phosphoribosyltransferase
VRRLPRLRDAIGGPREAAGAEAQRHLDALTKPPGSLGRLEELAVRLAALTGRPPHVSQPVIFTLAADHGVVAEHVSAYPQSVTAQMVDNFLAGGAAVNVLARQAGARVVVADFGIATPLGARPGLVVRRVDAGTRNMTLGPAMTREQATVAIEAGAGLAEDAIGAGADLLATGEMGIGNTTAASALAAALLGGGGERWAGRGTGLDDAGLARKREVIDAGLTRHQTHHADPLAASMIFGGRELAAILGATLAARLHRIPVLLDGFVATAAAAPLARLNPNALDHAQIAHCSAEAGHRGLCAALGMRPILDLAMRLGEGSGAALSVSVLRAALACHLGMATFDEAGVDERG